MNESQIDPHAQLLPTARPGAAFVRPSWLRRTAGRARPLLWPTTLLAAARWWHGQGAAHSAGDACLSGLLTAGALLVGGLCAVNGNRLTKGAALGLTIGAGTAAAGVAAYAGGLALPAVLWVVAAGAAVELDSLSQAAEAQARRRAAEAEAARQAEDERCEAAAAAAHQRRLERLAVQGRTEVTVEALRAYAQVSTAEMAAASAVAVAELQAGTAHAALTGMDRPALPLSERPAIAAYLAADAAATPGDDARWLTELSAG
jgi:Tfp pilus assembly major pilin PilA